MKKIMFYLSLAFLAFLMACSQNQPIACAADAKICQDGTTVGRTGQNCEFSPCPNISTSNQNESSNHYCTAEQRKGEMCIGLYQPVCGWFDPARIQCVKYPCAQTYSNSCFACKNDKVLYWTEGGCPK